jgi:3',5'-cyclic AMP phosphodiesterase CpdA
MTLAVAIVLSLVTMVAVLQPSFVQAANFCGPEVGDWCTENPETEASTAIPLWGPYITKTTETSATINWKTESAATGWLEYATDEYFTAHGEYSHAVSGGKMQLHHVTIADLVPDTLYHYRLRINRVPTADHTFRTFGSESFTFIVYGDTQAQPGSFTQMERHKLVADRIAEEEGVSFVIHTGDFVNSGSKLENWNDFFNAAREMLADTTIYPVLGNHELNHANYYDAFGVPGYYSFDYGNSHFTILDSNDWAQISTETAWLEDDLNCDAIWKFAFFHHPPYSSDASHWGGWINFRSYWEDIFIKNGVNVVFNGHVHVYERYLENGIHYIVCGIGGGPLYYLAEEKYPGYQNSFENTLGYARVTVNAKQAVIEIIKVADVSQEVTYIYPPNTIFETVVLGETLPSGSASVYVSGNVVTPTVGISLNRDSIDYGELTPGESSPEEVVGITNVGTSDVNVTLEIDSADDEAQDFYEQSLYLDGILYDLSTVITEIAIDTSEEVVTQLKVPSAWNKAGKQDAKFIFWAEAH